jgi:hypothetical protein
VIADGIGTPSPARPLRQMIVQGSEGTETISLVRCAVPISPATRLFARYRSSRRGSHQFQSSTFERGPSGLSPSPFGPALRLQSLCFPSWIGWADGCRSPRHGFGNLAKHDDPHRRQPETVILSRGHCPVPDPFLSLPFAEHRRICQVSKEAGSGRLQPSGAKNTIRWAGSDRASVVRSSGAVLSRTPMPASQILRRRKAGDHHGIWRPSSRSLRARLFSSVIAYSSKLGLLS